MTELLRHYLFYTFHSFTKYDYMAIGWILFLALLLLILGALVKRKSVAYFLLFMGLVMLFLGPPLIKTGLDLFIRPASVDIGKVKALRFSHTLVIEGNVTNRGKIDYSSCDLVVSIYRPAEGWKAWRTLLDPIKIGIERLDTPLGRGAAKPFRILVDHFNNGNDFNVSVRARCYP